MRSFLFFLLIFSFLFLVASPILGSFCIDINTASKQELEKITGVGPVLSQRIIDARPFSSLDEIIKVPGIAAGKLANIKDQGIACVSNKEIEKSIEKDIEENSQPILKSPANISRQIPEKENSLSVFLVALIISLFFGTIILIIKIKMVK